MKLRFVPLAAMLCAALAAAFAMTGCREDTIIKSSLTPAIDNIHTFGIGADFNNGTDTITIQTRTVFQDSVITSTRNNGFPIFHALGCVVDPFAGKTTAGIYLQPIPTAVGFLTTLGTNTIDQLVLVLPYAGFTWGDTTVVSTQTVNVYAINERFSKDSTFYNYSRKSTDPMLVGTGTFTTGPSGQGTISDSVTIRGVKQAPQLRITMTPAFLSTFLAALKADSTIPDFTTAFPGLYIVPADTSANTSLRALPYFRLNGTADVYGSAALVAYANNGAGNDSIVYQFRYDESLAAHFNRITRTYTGYEIAGLLDTTKVQPTVAMQNAPGASIDLTLPFIQNLPKNVIINKAEIVFTKVAATGDDKFFGPIRIYPQGINSSGGQYTIADRYPVNDASLNFIDGTATMAVKNGTTVTQYRINIPREVQTAIAAGSKGLHLRVGGTVNFPAAYRLVVGGSGNSNTAYRPAINIIYSKQ